MLVFRYSYNGLVQGTKRPGYIKSRIGCTVGHMPLSIVRKPYGRWADAVHLSNDHAEVVIIPCGGRIIRYARPGGLNMLWENTLTDVSLDTGVKGWHNPGGDKVWIWPDGRWNDVLGKAWPPPLEMDEADYEITVTGDAVRLVSPTLPKANFRIVREIQLDDNTAALQTVNRVEPVGEPADIPIAAWTVTQVPATQKVTVLVEAGSELNQMSRGKLAAADFSGPAAVLRRDPTQTAKVGLDGIAFRVEYDGVAFTQRLVGASDGEWGSGTRAQYYVEKDSIVRSTYMELEFTSPRSIVTSEGPWVAVRWELIDQPRT